MIRFRDGKRMLLHGAEKIACALKRAWKAVRGFSLRTWCREIAQELHDELTPFSWKKGLRYYRKPLVVLLIFCVLWATPVILANTARDTLFFWWPDYVIMPLITEEKRVEMFVPSPERKAQHQMSQDYLQGYRDYKLYSDLQNGLTLINGYYKPEFFKEGPPIVCKVNVLQTRDFFSAAVFKNQWQEDEWIIRGHRMIAYVLLEDIIFDPYDYYDENDKILISAKISLDDKFNEGDRLYLFLSHPLLPGNADTTYYDLGFVDNSSHYRSWYIREKGYLPDVIQNSVIFEDGTLEITGNPSTDEMHHTIEIYTEEQIDKYLYEKLTVYEDDWREHAEGRLQQ